MNISKKLAAISAIALLSVNNAFAAVPADVTTSLTDLKADVGSVAALAFAAFLVVILFHYMRSAAK
jgi:hypothetical protein